MSLSFAISPFVTSAIDVARRDFCSSPRRRYSSDGHDGDGILEYTQKLVSAPGKTDGLYWPAEQADGESPVGPPMQQAALQKARKGEGYCGYHFRFLKAQSGNVAGGKCAMAI